MGFRVEHSNGMNEAHGRAANYLFDANGVIETQPNVGSSVFTVNNAKFLPEPRAGLAWSPFGDRKTVIHAGFGMFYAQLDALSYRLDQNAPFNTTVTLKNISAAGLHISPGSALPAGALVSPSGIQPDAKIPAVESYTLKIEREITPSLAVGAGFVGSHGYHEILSLDANLPATTVCPAAPCPASLAAGTLYNPSGAPLANPAVANTTTWWSDGNSSYNALQIDVTRRFRSGLQFRGVYTFAKSLDDGTAWNSSVGANAPGFVMYPANPRLDWGLSTYDVRQAAVINATYDLPVARRARGLTRALAAGWTLGGIATLQSGLPFTPQLGFNPSNNGDSRNPVRPSWNPAFQGPVVLGRPERILQSGCLLGSGERHLRQRGTGYADRSGHRDRGSFGHEERRPFGKIAAPVSRRILQSPESRQFRNAEYGGLYFGHVRHLAHRGRDHLHLHHVAADSVWLEAAVVSGLRMQQSADGEQHRSAQNQQQRPGTPGDAAGQAEENRNDQNNQRQQQECAG